MYWKDEGYLLSKNSFDENSIIMEAFTLDHGKCSGIVYGGNSRKNKKIFQIGNKIFKREEAAKMQIDLFLSSKKIGDTGFINSILKYPILFSFLDLQFIKILLPI